MGTTAWKVQPLLLSMVRVCQSGCYFEILCLRGHGPPWCSSLSLLKRVHSSTEGLQCAISLHYYLLTSHVETPDFDSKPPPKIFHALSSTNCGSLNQTAMPSVDPPLAQAPTERCHEMMRKHSRRLYSWPSREVDVFEEDGALHVDLLPKMRMLESTSILSLAMFSSLLIEFVARLDHLVDAVDELSRMAKFKDEGI